MVDNLLLYNGPSQSGEDTYIVTMNETDDQLRFDITYSRDENTVHRHAYIFNAVEDRLMFTHFPNAHRDFNRPITWSPVNIFADLNKYVLDSSAHKVYRKAIFKMLRRYTTVDSFKTMVEPEKTISEAMYPMLKSLPINSYGTLRTLALHDRKEYLQSLRQPTVQDMTKKLFGEKRYRKDLVKAIAGVNSVEFLTFAFSLKREIPVDWFINILRNNPTLSYLPEEFSFNTLQRFYDSMSDKQFKKFCKCLMEEDFVPLQSILDMADQFEECLQDEALREQQGDSVTKIKFRNLEEFHYWIGKHHEITAKERERRELISRYGGELQGNDYYNAIKNIDFSGASYEVVIPQYAYELVNWGQEMSNCIGSYATRARESETDAYVALKSKDGTMKANVLISDRNVRQFFGKRNSAADSKLVYDFNMRLILGGVLERKSDLFGTHFNSIAKATGCSSIEEIKEDYKTLNVSMDEYIALRRP